MSDQHSPSHRPDVILNAVFAPDPSKVEALLKQGADVFLKDAWARTVLENAATLGRRARGKLAAAHAKLAALTLEHARSLPVERFTLSQAVVAQYPAAIHYNLEREPLGEGNADEFRKALGHAVEYDDAPVIELLLSAGLSPGAKLTEHTGSNVPALSFAASRGSTSAMAALLKAGADPDAQQEQAPSRRPPQFNFLPEAFQLAGVTALMHAAAEWNLAAVKLLVEASADLNLRDQNNSTALAYAQKAKSKRVIVYLEKAYEKQDAGESLNLCDAAASGVVYRVMELLARGDDLEQPNADGQTPLTLAVAKNQLEIVQLLCEAGANVQATHGPGGSRDLWDSARTWRNPDVIRCLIQHGLDVNKARAFGPPLASFLEMTMDQRGFLTVLLEAGADVHALVPPAVVKKQRERVEKFNESLKGSKKLERMAKDLSGLNDSCTVLEFAKYFAWKEHHRLLLNYAGIPEDSEELLYEKLKTSLKNCATLADEAFKAEAERVGRILGAKPQPWRNRKGVVHYISSLEKALAAYYGHVAPTPSNGSRGLRAPELHQLPDEVAAKGYTLVYTGLDFQGKGLTRLLLFPLAEPLAVLAACGTNAANYGLGTREVVNWCAETRKKYPFTLAGAGFDFMELRFTLLVKGIELLAARIAEFCPDVQVAADDPQAVAKFVEELIAQSGRCFFWWD